MGASYLHNWLDNSTPIVLTSATLSSEKIEAAQRIDFDQKPSEAAVEADRILRPIASHGVPLIRFEESHPQVSSSDIHF